eukprot:6286412-Lingulodinium_polyedra.AAC.1
MVTSAASWTCGAASCKAVNWPTRQRCRLCQAFAPMKAMRDRSGASARGCLLYTSPSPRDA